MLRGLSWLGAKARWVLAIGVVLATFLPSLSAFLRPYLPGLVVLILCVSIARLDLGLVARRAMRPGRLALMAGWTLVLLVATPALAWAAATAVGLPQAHVSALVYTFSAPPISSAPALCLLLGLEAAFALELTMVATMAVPFIGPLVTKALLGEAVPINAFDLTLRIAAMMGGGVVLAVALRWLIGRERIERNGGVLDGVSTLVLLIFVIPLFDGFWGVVAAYPWFALGSLALVLVANWGTQALIVLTGRRVMGQQLAGTAGLTMGNRNVTTYLAALPPDPLFGLYVAFYQIPMLFTPLVMVRVLRGRR